jgi:hypothetical protein
VLAEGFDHLCVALGARRVRGVPEPRKRPPNALK